MKRFRIYAGLGGGFGGATDKGIEEFKSESEALLYAYGLSCEEYEIYEGYHGLEDFHDIEEDPEYYGLDVNCTEEEIWEKYEECRENWIEYWVEEIDAE